MSLLLKSRKFWLMLADVSIGTAIFFVTKYISPDMAENILWLIGSWQPVIIALILGIAIEDSARFKGDSVVLAADLTANPSVG